MAHEFWRFWSLHTGMRKEIVPSSEFRAIYLCCVDSSRPCTMSRVIRIDLDPSRPLGFVVKGSHLCRVSEAPNSASQTSGLLMTDDHITSINGIDVSNYSSEAFVELLSELRNACIAERKPLSLWVRRSPAGRNTHYSAIGLAESSAAHAQFPNIEVYEQTFTPHYAAQVPVPSAPSTTAARSQSPQVHPTAHVQDGRSTEERPWRLGRPTAPQPSSDLDSSHAQLDELLAPSPGPGQGRRSASPTAVHTTRTTSRAVGHQVQEAGQQEYARVSADSLLPSPSQPEAHARGSTVLQDAARVRLTIRMHALMARVQGHELQARSSARTGLSPAEHEDMVDSVKQLNEVRARLGLGEYMPAAVGVHVQEQDGGKGQVGHAERGGDEAGVHVDEVGMRSHAFASTLMSSAGYRRSPLRHTEYGGPGEEQAAQGQAQEATASAPPSSALETQTQLEYLRLRVEAESRRCDRRERALGHLAAHLADKERAVLLAQDEIERRMERIRLKEAELGLRQQAAAHPPLLGSGSTTRMLVSMGGHGSQPVPTLTLQAMPYLHAVQEETPSPTRLPALQATAVQQGATLRGGFGSPQAAAAHLQRTSHAQPQAQAQAQGDSEYGQTQMPGLPAVAEGSGRGGVSAYIAANASLFAVLSPERSMAVGQQAREALALAQSARPMAQQEWQGQAASVHADVQGHSLAVRSTRLPLSSIDERVQPVPPGMAQAALQPVGPGHGQGSRGMQGPAGSYSLRLEDKADGQDAEGGGIRPLSPPTAGENGTPRASSGYLPPSSSSSPQGMGMLGRPGQGGRALLARRASITGGAEGAAAAAQAASVRIASMVGGTHGLGGASGLVPVPGGAGAGPVGALGEVHKPSKPARHEAGRTVTEGIAA